MFEPWVIWLILGLLLLAAEAVVPGVILVFFGLGALFTTFLVALGVEGLGLQLGIFAVSSVIMLLFLRRTFRETFSGGSDVDELLDEYIGHEVLVITSIPADGEGRVEIKGATWRARSAASLESGSRARIISRDGLLLHVEGAGR